MPERERGAAQMHYMGAVPSPIVAVVTENEVSVVPVSEVGTVPKHIVVAAAGREIVVLQNVW